MRYIILEITNTQGNAIAEFDDINRALKFVHNEETGKEEVCASDTDPQFIFYDICDTKFADSENPIGKIVWTTKQYYNYE